MNKVVYSGVEPFHAVHHKHSSTFSWLRMQVIVQLYTINDVCMHGCVTQVCVPVSMRHL